MAKILLNIRIDQSLRERLKRIAEKQNRTLSNYVETELMKSADSACPESKKTEPEKKG